VTQDVDLLTGPELLELTEKHLPKHRERLAMRIVDSRQARKVEHSIRDPARQRLFGIVRGYADCNDASRLVQDRSRSWLPVDDRG
jgi:hypothetical protein